MAVNFFKHSRGEATAGYWARLIHIVPLEMVFAMRYVPPTAFLFANLSCAALDEMTGEYHRVQSEESLMWSLQ